MSAEVDELSKALSSLTLVKPTSDDDLCKLVKGLSLHKERVYIVECVAAWDPDPQYQAIQEKVIEKRLISPWCVRIYRKIGGPKLTAQEQRDIANTLHSKTLLLPPQSKTNFMLKFGQPKPFDT